jgi:hypothetical protein
LEQLADGEHCVCDLSDALEADQSRQIHPVTLEVAAQGSVMQ